MAGGARWKRDNEKAFVPALFYQRRDEGLQYLRGATLVVALSLALFRQSENDLSSASSSGMRTLTQPTCAADGCLTASGAFFGWPLLSSFARRKSIPGSHSVLGRCRMPAAYYSQSTRTIARYFVVCEE